MGIPGEPRGRVTIVVDYPLEGESYPSGCNDPAEMVKFDNESWDRGELTLEDIISWAEDRTNVTWEVAPQETAGTEPLPGT